MTSRFADLAPVVPAGHHPDARGALIETLPDDVLRAGRVFNVHLVECRPGAVRGNHFHRRQTETMCVYGEFLVRVSDCEASVADLRVAREAPVIITLRPRIAHAFKCVGEASGYILAYGDRPFDPSETEPHELLV